MLSEQSIILDLSVVPWSWRLGLGALIGAIIGSFVAALVARWPRGESVVTGRSHCDACGATLVARDLIPIVGFLINRRRCRHCGAPIAIDHLLAEFGGAAVGASALLVLPSEIGLAGMVFGWALLALALLDARHFWLPDRIVLPLLLAGLAASFLVGRPTPLDAAIGAAAGFIGLEAIRFIYRRLRKREGMGAGDPKLLAATGAWIGWQLLPILLLVASAVGIVAILLAAIGGKPITRTTRLALGTMIAIAAWPIWLAAPWLGAMIAI